MAAYGLYSHIQSNRRRSIALMIGLFFLVYLLVFAGALVAEGHAVAAHDLFALLRLDDSVEQHSPLADHGLGGAAVVGEPGEFKQLAELDGLGAHGDDAGRGCGVGHGWKNQEEDLAESARRMPCGEMTMRRAFSTITAFEVASTPLER